MQSEAVVMNLKGGSLSLSNIEGKETDLQSCFDRHSIRLVKTLLLGEGYIMITFFKVIFDFYVMLDYHINGMLSSLRCLYYK